MTNKVPSDKPINSDEFELRLMHLLDSDPRMTYTDIALRLGVSRPTASAMVERLYRKGVRTACYVNDKVMGYKISGALCINTLPGSLFDAATGLASLAEIQAVMFCTGVFDIICWVVFKDLDRIPDFIHDRLGKIRGISRHELIICNELKPTHPRCADRETDGAGENEVTLDELDIALIKELQKNARETVTSLATKLGSSRPTIVRKMDRLLKDRVIGFRTIWGSYIEGERGTAIVGMKVSPSRIKDVGNALAAHERISSVHLCSGRYDVITWIPFKGQQNLIDFLTAEIGQIPGIVSMETNIGLKLIKH